MPNLSEVLLLLASMDDDDDRFPVLLVPVPGLCGSGAYVFSSGTRNNRRDLEEVASA